MHPVELNIQLGHFSCKYPTRCLVPSFSLLPAAVLNSSLISLSPPKSPKSAMADVENQYPLRNPPPYPQHLTETLTILLALASILSAIGMNPSQFVKPPYNTLSLVVMAALSLVWFGLFVLSSRLPCRFIIWGGLALVWVMYWIILHGILSPQFFWPMVCSFNLVLGVMLLLNQRFTNVWERGIQVMAENCRFWNYNMGNN